MNDVTLHVNVTPLTAEDQLLITTLQTEKAELLKMIFEIPARQQKWHMLLHLWIIESTGFAKRLRGSNRRRSEWTDSTVKSITITSAKMDNQVTHSKGGNVFC